jgi:hypothetical protein
MDFEQIVAAALALKTIERVKLVEKLMESLESSLKLSAEKPHPKDTLYDMLHEIYVSEEDRDELRRGMWEGFGSASRRDGIIDDTIPPEPQS